MYESLVAGVAFRAPAGWREDGRRTSESQVVQFTNDEKRWTLTVNRLTFNPPIEMTFHRVPNPDGSGFHDVNGLFQETINRLKLDSPGVEIARQDINQANGIETGLIAARAHNAGDDTVTLLALVHPAPVDAQKSAASAVYYSFNLNAPVSRSAKLEESPDVHQLVDTFDQVLDSVKLLDQSAIRADQDERLFRTRALFVNLTEEHVRKVMIPEQWLRLLKDGKDVGYMYIVEEVARDLPRRGVSAQAGGGPEGVLIGVRSRTMPQPGTQVDVASWAFSFFDRSNEKWTNITAVRDPTDTQTFSEIGAMQTQRKLVPERGLQKGELTAKGFDAQQPAVRQRDVRKLDVYFHSREHNAPSFEVEVAPWYLPQAALQLLPRLVAAERDKTFLFAAYNGDKRVVMARYIDVGHEQTVEIGGKSINAIPVDDRWGLEGSITTHFVSKDGKYFGSVNRDSHIVILPSDRATLEKMWQNAELTRPKEPDEKDGK